MTPEKDWGSVRRWFRVMRTADHLRDARWLDQIQKYTTGDYAIIRVGDHHLYDASVPDAVTAVGYLHERHRISEILRRKLWLRDAAV